MKFEQNSCASIFRSNFITLKNMCVVLALKCTKDHKSLLTNYGNHMHTYTDPGR